MAEMVKQEVIPSCISYQGEISQLLREKNTFGKYDSTLEEGILQRISYLSAGLLKKLDFLEDAVSEARGEENELEAAKTYRDKVVTAMTELRFVVDDLEVLIAKKYWRLPTYGEMLYSVN